MTTESRQSDHSCFRITSGRGTSVWLLLAGLVCVGTRLPALRGGALSDDEAIYATMAKEVVAGGVMYRDVVDHKPPGLTYTYAAVQALVGDGNAWPAVHLVGLLAALGTVIALAGIARLLFPSEWFAVLPPLLYALATAAKQRVDGLAVNGELLMNFPLALAVWLALSRARGAGRRAALDGAVGILIGVAALYKYQASVAGAAFIFLIDRKTWLRPVMWLAGYLLPLSAALAWFAHRGALPEMVSWGLRFNGRYLSAGPSLRYGLQRLGIELLGVVIPSALLYLAGVVALMRPAPGAATPEASRHRRFLKTWALLSIFCVTLGGRFFGHYFLQAELPLALLAAEPIGLWLRRAPRRVAVMLALPTLLFVVVASIPRWSDQIFERGQPDYAEIGAVMRQHTRADQTIWVWGNAPQIYSAASRRAGTRFVFCNYLTGLSPATPSESDQAIDPAADAMVDAWPLLLSDLDRRRPTLVLDTSEPGIKAYGKFPIRRYPLLAAYLDRHYRIEGYAAGIPFYRRTD